MTKKKYLKTFSGKFTTRHVVNRVESPFAPFLRNIIKLAKELKMKMKPRPGGKKDKLLLKIAQVELSS